MGAKSEMKNKNSEWILDGFREYEKTLDARTIPIPTGARLIWREDGDTYEVSVTLGDNGVYSVMRGMVKGGFCSVVRFPRKDDAFKQFLEYIRERMNKAGRQPQHDYADARVNGD